MADSQYYLQDVFDLPMDGAIQFWRDKVQMGMGEFIKLSDAEKIKSFAISGIARGDELSTVFTALQDAIERGESFGTFKKKAGDIFTRRGWTGKRAWRVDNIYRTNIQTAYNVGRYKQLKEEASIFPYWQYDAINDKRTRPTHLAMDGRVWPADHSVWNTWYPPNGYRCRCSVIGLTQGAVERKKIHVESEDITNRLIEPISPVSGEKMGGQQMLPDIGFAHNPGATYWGEIPDIFTDRINSWPAGIGRQAINETINGPVFAKWYSQPEGHLPIARISENDMGKIGAKTRTTLLSQETAVKQQKKHPELAAKEYTQVQEAMDGGLVVQDGKKTLVFILDDTAQGYVTVVKSTRTGDKVFLTSFRRLSKDQARKDKEIQRLLKKEKT